MRVLTGNHLLIAALTLFASAAAARGQEFQDLAKRVPAGANTLVLINVDRILESPVAIREKWKAKHEQVYAAGLSMIPPDAKQAVFANQMDLETMTPIWESVVMRLQSDPDLAGLAKSTGGTPESVGKCEAISWPSSAFAVCFGDNIVGALTPTNRQSVGRWLRDAETKNTPDLSAYLKEAYNYANGIGTPVILAIDLQDIATPAEVLAMLKASDRFINQKESEQQRLAKTIAGIRGLTLGVTLGEKPLGKVKVDFADDFLFSPDLAKAMLLHALAKRGAMIKDLNDWTPQVDGRTVTLEGTLTTSGMKRIFSLFDRAPSFKQAPAESAGPPTDDRSKLYAAQTYFKNVADYVKDLRSDSSDAVTFGQVALWYDKFARKIDQMSVVGVDPEVIAYGQRTANALRQASAQIKEANYQKGVRQANVQPQYVTNEYAYTYGYSYGWYGGGGPVGNYGTYTTRDYSAEQGEKRTIRQEETANAGLTASQIMQQIDQDTASTRQRMSLKYKENF